MQIINNQKLNKSNISIEEIFEMIENGEVDIIRSWGKYLENHFILFKLINNTFVIAKNCQSVLGWHCLEFFSSEEAANNDFDINCKDDYENLTRIEMILDPSFPDIYDSSVTKEELLEDD